MGGEETKDLALLESFPQCPRCHLVFDPRIDCAPLDGYCPRCAYDVFGTIDMETSELVDPEFMKSRAGALAFIELCIILDNWLAGYMRVVARDGVDWSLPHEFLEEFGMQMVPYISRLKERGYSTPERMAMIGGKVQDALALIVEALEQEEGLMRLTGEWTDKEQEIKDHWWKEAQKGITHNMGGK